MYFKNPFVTGDSPDKWKIYFWVGENPINFNKIILRLSKFLPQVASYKQIKNPIVFLKAL